MVYICDLEARLGYVSSSTRKENRRIPQTLTREAELPGKTRYSERGSTFRV